MKYDSFFYGTVWITDCCKNYEGKWLTEFFMLDFTFYQLDVLIFLATGIISEESCA